MVIDRKDAECPRIRGRQTVAPAGKLWRGMLARSCREDPATLGILVTLAIVQLVIIINPYTFETTALRLKRRCTATWSPVESLDPAVAI